MIRWPWIRFFAKSWRSSQTGSAFNMPKDGPGNHGLGKILPRPKDSKSNVDLNLRKRYQRSSSDSAFIQ
jgi:hypothetical protein